MEKNNFNKAYIYIVAIFAIGIAMANIISFFNGVGFALIGAIVLLVLAISNVLKSEDKKRFGDILGLIIIEFLMFVVLYFAYDFNLNGITNKFPLVMRNICAIYSILALGYVIFRYISEIKGKKYNFVEYMLGNYTPTQKPRKEKKAKPSKAEIKRNRELENGTLEPKPSTVEHGVSETTPIASEESVENVAEDKTNEQVKEEEKQQENPQSITNTTNRTGFWY